MHYACMPILGLYHEANAILHRPRCVSRPPIQGDVLLTERSNVYLGRPDLAQAGRATTVDGTGDEVRVRGRWGMTWEIRFG